MLATPSATCQSPVGSAASADPEITPVAKISPENAIVRANDLGQCNMVRTYALLLVWAEGQNAALGVFS
jgi:hypothetical protein